MEERCVNCGKTKDRHIIDAASLPKERNYCSATLGDNRRWLAPMDAQTALFETEKRGTGYEI